MKKTCLEILDFLDWHPQLASVLIAVVLAFGLVGCSTPTVSRPDVFIDGLHLGDISAKRAAAKRILRTPINFTAPEAIDNSAYVSAIQDQGDLPECAARSESAVLAASYWRSKNVKTTFDAHGIYQAAKAIEGNRSDGTTLDAVLRAVTTRPFAPSGEIPTITDGSLLSMDDLPFAVHRYGFVWVGLRITDAWYKPDARGLISNGGKTIGGHAVVVVGYNTTTHLVKILNSWGTRWGKDGFCYLTFEEFERELGYGITQLIEWFPQDRIKDATNLAI